MDSLAARGVRFENTYVTQPLCVPYRTAQQLGCWPHQTGVMVNAQKTVAEDAPMYPMIGRLVHDAGYRCGFIGKMHIAYRDRDNQRHISLRDDQFEMHGYDPVLECADSELPSRAARFFETGDSRPFFLTTSFLNPHDCMAIAKNRDAQEHRIGPLPDDVNELPPLPDNFEIPEDEPSVIREHWERYSVPFKGGSYTPYPTRDWDDLRWRQYLWGYYRLVELVDSQIGAVLDVLQASGKADETLVIFTADHGDGAGHHHWYQKQVLYDEVVRVPFIVAGPCVARLGTVDRGNLMSAIDIPPTILDYAGADRPDHVEGRSLRPLLETGEWTPNPYVVSETLFGTGTDIVGWAGRMVRTRRYKYTVYNHGEIREQLNDMKSDAGEMVNLAMDPERQVILQKHRDYLSEWCEQTGDAFLHSCRVPAE
jgi:arylsulfatase A-like enzyme